jgi:UDP-glucose 4-epimerase
MQVLITGGAGYIGSHLVTYLEGFGVDCYVVDNLSRGRIERLSPKTIFEQIDLCDNTSLRKFMMNHSFDAIFHLAGYMQARESTKHPSLYLRNNVESTRSLIQSISHPERTKVIFGSSCSVYGNNDLAMEVSPYKPLSIYAETKVQSEIELTEFFKASPQNLTIFRFFNVVGCLDRSLFCDIQTETILPSSARKIIDGEKPLIFGGNFTTVDGFAIRDFIDVRDLVIALSLPLDKQLSGVHNLSSNQPMSIKTLVELLLEISNNKELGFEVGVANSADPSTIRSLTSTKVRDLLWSPYFSIRESVENFWNVFSDYYQNKGMLNNRTS